MEFCGFLSYINKNQPQVHPCPVPSISLPTPPATEPLFEFPGSYSKFPLAICFTHGVVNFCYSVHTLPLLLPLLLPCPQVCSLCLFLHCHPENKVISAFSSDSIYMCQYTIFISLFLISVQFSSVTQSCPTLCDPMNHSMPGLPVHHQLPEITQTHVHRVSDAIQPSHPLLSPSPPAPNPSQHQNLF